MLCPAVVFCTPQAVGVELRLLLGGVGGSARVGVNGGSMSWLLEGFFKGVILIFAAVLPWSLDRMDPDNSERIPILQMPNARIMPPAASPTPTHTHADWR